MNTLLLRTALLALGGISLFAQISPDNAAKDGCGDFDVYFSPGLLLTQMPPVGVAWKHYVDVKAATLPPSGVTGTIRFSHLSDDDLMADHKWHDFNFYVALDPSFIKFNSQTNYKPTDDYPLWNINKEELLMEVEWDSSEIPARFWASSGDQVWMTGRYIWDCGHMDVAHTEIHPPKALALTRLEPTRIGGDSTPSFTNVTYVYVHGESGVKQTIVTPGGIAYQPVDVPVADEVYEFDIYTPKRPTNLAGDPFWQLLDLPYGGPSPQLSLTKACPNVGDACTYHVKYPLNLRLSSPTLQFGAVIATGWRTPPLSVVHYKDVVVHLDRVIVNKKHNPLCLDDWRMWINVNGNWIEAHNLAGVDEGSPSIINQDVHVLLPLTPDGKYNGRLLVQASGWGNIFDGGFGMDPAKISATLATPNALQALTLSTTGGELGILFDVLTVANAELNQGVHDRTWPSMQNREVDGTLNASETAGDYQLVYKLTVSDIK